MDLNCKNNKNGFAINYNNKSFNLIYPEKIWKYYPEKAFLTDNLAHLLTINTPLISNHKEVTYNTSLPLFKTTFHNMVLESIPQAVEEYKTPSLKVIKEFLDTKYIFKDDNIKYPHRYEKLKDRAVVSLSLGKDSLLSLAVCKEINLNPIITYINDTVSPGENRTKIAYTKKLAKQEKLTHYIITNEIEKLNDFEFWNKPETTLGYTHMMTSFLMIMLPISHHHKAKYFVVGNEYDLNYLIMNKDKFLTNFSFDQSEQWMKVQNFILKTITNNESHVMSVIEPLTELAIIKILYGRYKNLAKFHTSCSSLDASLKRRWCEDCTTCASVYIHLLANNINPKIVGLKTNMLTKSFEKYHYIFGKTDNIYSKSKEATDMILLSFYLAYKNNAKGYLIDKFKKLFLDEVRVREDELIEKYLTPKPSVTMPIKIKREILSIYREELGR